MWIYNKISMNSLTNANLLSDSWKNVAWFIAKSLGAEIYIEEMVLEKKVQAE